MKQALRALVVLSVVFLCCGEPASAPTAADLREILASQNYPMLKGYGEKALPGLLDLYQSGDEDTKGRVANAFYLLSLKSERARMLLWQDIHTENQQLRIAVQSALGRVSSDDTVVHPLLDDLQSKPATLFHDKAAGELWDRQVHLTERQRVILLEGLVTALENDAADVRRIALSSLEIQTGQTKGYDPEAPAGTRTMLVEPWKRWVAEYRRNIDGN